ncbi:MAG: CHAT domain-containing protein [Cyanobacteria bacterium SID2]|nr:CHAT domain-containing protein [Cyanobacteria bacterium SID2]MBP0006719.1 CHAT domain-containing protein [Cyanobacteria bacterium SBC]
MFVKTPPPQNFWGGYASIESLPIAHWRGRLVCPLALVVALALGVRNPATAIESRQGDTGNPTAPDSLAVRPATGTDPIARSAGDLVQQGRDFYRAGQFADAIEIWQAAALDLGRSGNDSLPNVLDRVLVFSYLASAFQQLGQWPPADRAMQDAFALISTVAIDGDLQQVTHYHLVLAQAFNTRGHLQLARGRAVEALKSWQQAEANYRRAGDEEGVIGSQIDRTQALQALGQYQRARETLENVDRSLQASPDSPLKATGLLNLGNTLRAVGDFDRSQQVLQQSLEVAERLPSSLHVHAALLGLAQTSRFQGNLDRALAFYERAATIAPSPLARVRTQIDRLSLAVETEQWENARTLWQSLQSQLFELPPNRTTVDLRVNAARSLIKWQTVAVGEMPNVRDVAELLATAIRDARSLQDRRAEAYAVGELADLYERTNREVEALDLAQQALVLAETADAPDIAYQLQWQTGRLFNARGDRASAMDAYGEAVNTLNAIRKDLVVTPELQFSFRERVEPVYREFVGLLLAPEASQSDLERARQTIEALQLAELENFFREACLDARPQQIDEIDSTAAAIYPIILLDRLAVVLSVPGQPLRYYDTRLPQSEVERILREMQASLNPSYPNQWRLQLSEQVYDWLIRPAEGDLASHEIETLVFVLDGLLRNLPMAALYDGDRYLIEQYGIALAPGLQLIPSDPIDSQRLQVLIGGLTEARQGFSALPGVSVELEQIGSEGIDTSVPILNEQFTENNLENQIGSTVFPIVHLATHGQLSSDPAKTFVLTWDDKIDVKELGRLLRARSFEVSLPIELLVLSACQTASGDDRAALGLAGLAVRSGVRSTLATLWSVNDRSTALMMGHFYRELARSGMSKAEALRQSQLMLLQNSQYDHPFFWSPFVMVGNWF